MAVVIVDITTNNSIITIIININRYSNFVIPAAESPSTCWIASIRGGALIKKKFVCPICVVY